MKYMVSMNNVIWDCKILSGKVLKSGFEPNVILAVSRGGLIPAGFLSHLLNIKNIQTVCLEAYDLNDEAKEVSFIHGPNPHLFGLIRQSVLVVDDVLDTGRTWAHIRKLFKPVIENLDLRLAVMHYKGRAPEPDYYTSFVEEDNWIVYPWEDQQVPTKKEKYGKKHEGEET